MVDSCGFIIIPVISNFFCVHSWWLEPQIYNLRGVIEEERIIKPDQGFQASRSDQMPAHIGQARKENLRLTFV